MKKYKRCPRCGSKVVSQFQRCGNCKLNFDKFFSATNLEAKSAIRMGEKERVLHSTTPPSDINKLKILLFSIFGGIFGLEYFAVGRYVRGIAQAITLICGIIYSVLFMNFGRGTGYLADLTFALGTAWVIGIVLWISNIIKICFNKFKYPVALPYSNQKENKGE